MSQNTPGTNPILIFALAAAALAMFILAALVDMPLRAILVAVGFSEVIFLILLMAGKILPGNRR